MTDSLHGISFIVATAADAERVAEARIHFLAAMAGPRPAEVTDMLRQELIAYFRQFLADGRYICHMAVADEQIAGIGGVAIRINPGSYANPTGKVGYVMNMYTDPGYRGRGICAHILHLLVADAQRQGIDFFELHAAQAGERIYQRFGFKQHTEPTYRMSVEAMPGI